MKEGDIGSGDGRGRGRQGREEGERRVREEREGTPCVSLNFP